MKYFTRSIFIATTLASALLFAGCAKTSVDEIPSYISIDSSSINVNSMQGTASQKISDAWVYAGNELLGAYELPKQRIPILKSGSTELSVFAGIKLNGINETRVAYPFYEKITRTVTLEREKIIKLGALKFSYVEGTKFAWQENFEEVNLSLDSTARSEVNFTRTKVPELATAFPYEINEYAAKVIIPSDTVVFECASHDSFILPTNGKSVFLELNYKTNNPFTVGLIVNGTYTSYRPVLVINPNREWNKIYINLTPTVSNYSTASSFGVFLSAIKSTEEPNAEIFFDNFKLLHF